MKKLHIFLLIAVAAAIAVMISFTTDLTTYDTIHSIKHHKIIISKKPNIINQQ